MINTIAGYIVTALLCFGLGSFFGYNKGSEEVTRMEATYKLAKENLDKKQVALQDYIEKLNKEHKQQVENINKGFSEFIMTQRTVLLGKDKEITRLKNVVISKQSTLEKLRLDLAVAGSDQDKAELLEKIRILENEIGEARIRQQGLDCLTIPIPEEYVSDRSSI